MLSCPRCDGQCEVKKVRVLADGELLYLCDECDATWFHRESVKIGTPWVQFTAHMEKKGLPALWSEIEVTLTD